MSRQALRCGLPPVPRNLTFAASVKSPDIFIQTKWNASLVNHMFPPPPATRYSALAGSKSTEPGWTALPMSCWLEKIPISPKTNFVLMNHIPKIKMMFFVINGIQILPLHRLQIVNAPRNLLLGQRRFVLDEIPFHADFFCGA